MKLVKGLVSDLNNSFISLILSCSVCIVSISVILLSISKNDLSELPDVESSVDDSVSDLPDYENVSFDTFNGNVNRVYIWTDEETGVQYIVYREKSGYAGFGGITPRFNADGTLYIVDSE